MRDSTELLDALYAFGLRCQLTKALEEFTELNMAILHHMDGRDNSDNLAEEIVDAEIMLDQLKLMLKIRNPTTDYDFDAARAAKITRLTHRVQLRKQQNDDKGC